MYFVGICHNVLYVKVLRINSERSRNMTIIIVEISLSLVIILFVFWWLRQLNKNKQFYKNIPSVPYCPILGNALDFGSTTALLKTFQKYTKDYGEIVKFQIGPIRKFILVSDYKFLECILSSVKLLNKSDDYIFLRPWLGTGLLTSDGPKWKKHRRILTPAFHFQILEQFINTFESCGEKLVQKLEQQIGINSFDIYPYVTLCTLDIICESTMGISINAQDDNNSDYVQSVKAMCRITVERALSPLQMYDFLFPLTKNYYAQKKALKILHGHSNSVISKRREELKNKTTEIVADNYESRHKKAFLDLLLDAEVDGRPLTQEEIREEVDTFMFEGHDTTASAISFSLFCLANHPEVQAKAFEEQQMIFGKLNNQQITYADLQKMKYLEQVIKETLRLYPSVPVYLRETNADVLQYGDISLPQGDTIAVFAFGIHRNPKYFKNPEEFNPDRFEEIDGKLPYAYIPFSAGPRNCIGQKFAMLEMKSTISKILRKFELKPATPDHVLILTAETVLKSTNGIKISLKLRQ